MRGKVIWITGLSGSGKTTLANEVGAEIRKLKVNPIILDGDILRAVLALEDADHFSKEQRLNIALRYSKICKVLSSQGFVVIIATISMFKEVYHWNRENLPGYFEVYLKVPMNELKRRDSNKIYSNSDLTRVKNVVGLDIKVDEPVNADLVFTYDPLKSVSELAELLIEKAELNPV